MVPKKPIRILSRIFFTRPLGKDCLFLLQLPNLWGLELSVAIFCAMLGMMQPLEENRASKWTEAWRQLCEKLARPWPSQSMWVNSFLLNLAWAELQTSAAEKVLTNTYSLEPSDRHEIITTRTPPYIAITSWHYFSCNFDFSSSKSHLTHLQQKQRKNEGRSVLTVRTAVLPRPSLWQGGWLSTPTCSPHSWTRTGCTAWLLCGPRHWTGRRWRCAPAPRHCLGAAAETFSDRRAGW